MATTIDRILIDLLFLLQIDFIIKAFQTSVVKLIQNIHYLMLEKYIVQMEYKSAVYLLLKRLQKLHLV